MASSRLGNNSWNREESVGYKSGSVKPKKIFFLSLEGADTERIYFEGVKNLVLG